MANEKDVARIRQGVAAWNGWRAQNRERPVDLSHADLREANITQADLRRANITQADLRGAKVYGAKLSGADLRRANITQADLRGADLGRAILGWAILIEAILEGADLRGADLGWAILGWANLIETNLEGANLSGANLEGADLRGANLNGAFLLETVFANVDLSATKGLDACRHNGPSVLDHRTLQRSGRLPLAFLRGCGLSDWQIEAEKLHEPCLNSEQITDILYNIHKLRSTRPIQIHNLFISYSHADSVFLEHMEVHLNERGIRFWRDTHDAPAGPLEKIVVRAIRHNPTVLLVLSENSVKSDWVEFEAQTARELEKELGRHVLCPVALDKSWLSCNWSAVLRHQIKKYHVLNFSDWQHASAFKSKFERLLSGIHLFYGGEGQQESQQTAD